MNPEQAERSFFIAVLGPLMLAIAALALVGIVGFSVLSAVRAYVAGESLWSKGRSAAVAALRDYAASGDVTDYQRFEAALAVPLGDRRARLELDKPQPDFASARAGFLAGQNAPEDVDGMIRLYRWFRDVSFMREAIAAWTRGDVLVAELQQLGLALRERELRGERTQYPAVVREHIDTLDAALVAAERHFSATLGRASGLTERLLIGTTLALASLLALGSMLFVRRTLRAQIEDRRALVEANGRWDLAADAAGIGVFEWWHAEDRFVGDARVRAIYQVEADARLGRAELRARVHPDDRERVRQRWETTLAGSDLFHDRYRLELPDGRIRHVETTGQVRDRDAPRRMRVVGVVRDITDEAALAQLTTEKQAAERVAQARVAFLSRLSHELRTPLNAVLGLAQLLRIDAEAPLAPAQDRRVRIILESGQQLLRLVEDVLDITRIDSGAIGLKIAPTDLHDSLRASLNLIEPERAAFGISIDDRLPAQPLRVLADPQRLQQVFVNLLSNGCKYNRPGGRLAIGAHEAGPWMRIAFSDQGQGLDEAGLRELFQPFKRLTPAPRVNGSGLGLVVVKLLVDQMQGSIDVRSAPGQGSCFTLSMPKA